jgi:MFS family permease
VVGLISLAHGVNHLFNIITPSLSIVWTQAFGISYAEVGLVISVAALTSASAGLPVGFLVDRLPARFALMAGMALMSLAVIGFGLAHAYWQLLVCAVALGLGNTVFHPCNYTILSATVPRSWLGRAFSVHTFSGYVGFALTPMIVSGALICWTWHGALIALGLLGLAIALLLFANRQELHDDRSHHAGREERRPGVAEGIRLLFSLPLVMCFAFYLLVTMASSGFNSFLPAALHEYHAMAEAGANLGLTVYFSSVAIGILIGGQIADRTTRHGTVAVVGFGIAAVAIWMIGDIGQSTLALFLLIGVGGFGAGIVTPSRDLIVRKVTPAGQTGKVFAFMTLAMDSGGASAPPVYGVLMDQGAAVWLFRLSSILLVGAILTVVATRRVHGRLETVR